MKKVAWLVEAVQADKKVTIPNIVSATFNNYSDKEVTITVNGIPRVIPGRDVVNNIPTYPFKVELCGYAFDAEVTIKFQTGFKNVIIDYGQIKDC